LSGIASSAFSLGEVIGPPLGSGLTDIVGFPWSCVIFGVLVFGSAMLILGMSIYEKANAPEERRPLIQEIRKPVVEESTGHGY